MMTNEELLAELRSRLDSGELSAAAVQALMPEDVDTEFDLADGGLPYQRIFSPSFSVTRLLYIVGGIFITLGVLYLVSQLWNDLSSFNRIFITLGLGLVFAGVGSRFMMSEPERDLGNLFHAIGGFLIPGGALVTLDELTSGIDSIWPVTLTVGMVFVFYVLLVLYHHRVILNFFAFATGTALIYLLMEAMVPSADGDLYAYLTMMIGVSYLIYAHVYQRGWNDRLIPLLLFFGALGFYTAAFSQIFDTIFMELLFPFLAFGGSVIALVVLKSRIVLLLSTLAVIGYIIYFTAEYFADSIGWPVTLILLGFIIIGLGYFSISLNRKYLRT
jgi:hypothetical protein